MCCSIHWLLIATTIIRILLIFKCLPFSQCDVHPSGCLVRCLLSQSPWGLFTVELSCLPVNTFCCFFPLPEMRVSLCCLRSFEFHVRLPLVPLFWSWSRYFFFPNWNTIGFLDATFSIKQFLIPFWTLVTFCVSHNICSSLFGGTTVLNQNPNVRLQSSSEPYP